MMATAAIALALILLVLALFQASLAAGAPLGHFAWGGQHRILPMILRVGSVLSIVIYAGIASIALQRAGAVVFFPDGEWLRIAAWVTTAYLALGIPLNAVSRSLPERLTMTPVVIVLFALSCAVALS